VDALVDTFLASLEFGGIEWFAELGEDLLVLVEFLYVWL